MKLYNPTDVVIPSVIQVGNVVKKIVIAPKSESKSLSKDERDHMKGIFPMLEDRPDENDKPIEEEVVPTVAEIVESEVEVIEVKPEKKESPKPEDVTKKAAKEILSELDSGIFDDSVEEFIADPTKKK